MQKLPSTSDLQTLFADSFGDDEKVSGFSESMVSPLYRSAKDSERAVAAATGMVRAVAQSFTAGGINPAPILKLLCFGMALGIRYCETAESSALDSIDPSFTNWLTKLDIDPG